MNSFLNRTTIYLCDVEDRQTPIACCIHLHKLLMHKDTVERKVLTSFQSLGARKTQVTLSTEMMTPKKASFTESPRHDRH